LENGFERLPGELCELLDLRKIEGELDAAVSLLDTVAPADCVESRKGANRY
jgi:hypothetical protein